MADSKKIEQFSISSIIIYHLLPGIPILLVAIIFANPDFGLGLPIFLALMLAIFIGLIPVQLGILFFYAKKKKKTINEIISFKHKTPWKQLIIWVIAVFLLSLFIFIILPSFEHPLWTIFDWVPSWFRIDRFSLASSAPSVIWLTIILGFIGNGVAGPFVEELYFRGFLLPRMEILGKSAPLVNSILFSLYHFFTPWENITRILAITPMAYAVWYKKDIRIGMFVHISLNTFSMIGILATVL